VVGHPSVRVAARAHMASFGGCEPIEALAAVALSLYTVTSGVGEGRGGSLEGN